MAESMILRSDNFMMLLLTGVLVASAVIDIRVQKIPNLLTYPVTTFAILYHTTTLGVDGFVFSLLGLALGIGLLVCPYICGTGAGDVKLMGTVGACLGPNGVFLSFLFSSIAGGVYALLIIVFRSGYGKRLVKRCGLTLKTLFLTRQFIPVPESGQEKKPILCYGVAIAAGTIFYMCLALSGKKFFF